MTRKWTPERDARLCRLSSTQLTDEQISFRMGFSVPAIRMRRHVLGIRKKAA